MIDELVGRIADLQARVARLETHGTTPPSTDGTLAGDSDTVVPTEAAVKEYVDGEITTLTTYVDSKFVPLTEPYTSTSWDGDSKTSANDGTLDLSALFGVPAGVAAVAVRVDVAGASSAAGNGIWLSAGSSVDPSIASKINVATVRNTVAGIVPCDANGDIYAAIAGTITVWIYITGYWT